MRGYAVFQTCRGAALGGHFVFACEANSEEAKQGLHQMVVLPEEGFMCVCDMQSFLRLSVRACSSDSILGMIRTRALMQGQEQLHRQRLTRDSDPDEW